MKSANVDTKRLSWEIALYEPHTATSRIDATWYTLVTWFGSGILL